MPNPRWTHEQRQEALRLVPELGHAETARRLGIPVGTITCWASKAQIKAPSAEKTQKAVAAYCADNAARRALLAKGLLADAAKLRDQLFAKSKAYNFGGKDNTFNEHEVPEPSFRDKQAILTSIGIALQRSLELERFDADGTQGIAAVDEWLRTVRGQ